MDPIKQNITIANSQGWRETLIEKNVLCFPGGYQNRKVIRWVRGDGDFFINGRESLPDYLNDLNLMREAEMSLSSALRSEYRFRLCLVTFMDGGPIHATAAQRAEAFLKTIGKWEYTVT